MLRDQLLTKQSGSRLPYSESAIHLVLSNILNSSLASSKAAETSLLQVAENSSEEEGVADRHVDQYWIHHYLDLAAIALGPTGNA
jgi:hypothetical protein